ncbi:MAG: methylmalonate-semialdehyde dehydrogenase (CoA acylating) [Alphaproteobacteria bacterium]|nr:methylmalonate-semialdehyde dehydrogenase (CoA acylating) [Alphaproteobacteria bacterium]
MSYIVPHIIGGKTNDSGIRMKDLFEPATGRVIGRVPIADEALCEQAVLCAKNAFHTWSSTPAIKRAHVLFKFREKLLQHQNELAKTVTREHGKTIEDAKGSVARGIELVEHQCAIMSQLIGEYSANIATDLDTYTLRQPLGICAGISPFNFPVMVPIWMMIPAIACGNTFILKPSEQDPSAPNMLLELLSEAGLPPGVVNIIQGDKTTVDCLIQHPDIEAITAVASTPVAEYIYHEATKNGKRAHTFGGAKNHCVVMPDANMSFAAKSIAGAAFGSAGERCMAISAVVCVGEQTPKILLDHLLPEIQSIKIDSGDAKDVDMGPVISQVHLNKLLTAIDNGLKEGANLLIDGRKFKHKTYPNGFYLGPSVFCDVTKDMSIYQEELFGPILVMLHVPDLEHALKLINENQYGNGTAIFTADGFTARQYCQQVQVGMVGVNVPIPVPVTAHPFGGWKRSSFGDTNMHGLESVHFYTRRKTITQRWPKNQLTENAFVMPSN